jgi:predicted dehydrogenase
MSETRDKVRIGIVGAGAICQIVHAPIFAEREDVELVALADADTHKAEVLSRRFGGPLVMDADDLIRSDELDAVVLCTPNGLHEEMGIAALEAGKHVLVERPLAATAAGAARVVDAAEACGQVLQLGMPHRYRPEVAALRSFVEGGEMGALYSARCSWLTRSSPPTPSSWRNDASVSGGGALVDLGLPALDLCLWVIGFPEISRVGCVLGPSDQGIECAATLILETRTGVALSVEVSNRFYSSEDRYYLRVMGAEGSASLPPLNVFKQVGGRPLDVTPRQPTPRGGENPYTNAYRRLLDDFVRRVSGLSDSELPREQVQLMNVVEAAYRAAESGAQVSL